MENDVTKAKAKPAPKTKPAPSQKPLPPAETIPVSRWEIDAMRCTINDCLTMLRDIRRGNNNSAKPDALYDPNCSEQVAAAVAHNFVTDPAYADWIRAAKLDKESVYQGVVGFAAAILHRGLLAPQQLAAMSPKF